MMKRIVFATVLVAGAAALWYWLHGQDYFAQAEFSADPKIAELQRLQKNIVAQTSNKPGSMPDDAQMRAMGEKIRGLSDEQRRAFFESSRSVMMGMMEARMKRFFELPADEQTKQLDEDIDRMEKARKEGRGFGPFGGGPPGGSKGGGNGAGNSSAGGNSNSAAKTGESDDARKRFADMTPEERNERRREMLSHTTPENRAMFTEYKTRMDARMKQRGLQPPRFP